MKINKYETYPTYGNKETKKIDSIDKTGGITREKNISISSSKNINILKESEILRIELNEIINLIENNLEEINSFRNLKEKSIDELIGIQMKFIKKLDADKNVFLKINNIVKENIESLILIKGKNYVDRNNLINSINKEMTEYVRQLEGIHEHNSIFLGRLEIAIIEFHKSNPYISIERIENIVNKYDEFIYRKDIGPDKLLNMFIIKNKGYLVIIILMFLFTILIIRSR